MNQPDAPVPYLEKPVAAGVFDALIRFGLVLVLALLCFWVFSPFLALMAWSLILAVTLYPMHQRLAARLGGKQGLAATVLVLAGIVLIGVPTAVLVALMGDSMHGFVTQLRDNTLQVPPPAAGVAEWPLVGAKAHDLWTRAHADLPAMLRGLQPQIADLSIKVLGAVAATGGAMLAFMASFIVAGIMMAWGEAGARSLHAIFVRFVGPQRGTELTVLCTATIRAVALGVIGVALIQAIVVGLVLVFAKIPFAGVLAGIVLILGIAQVPALIVTLPAVAYIWITGPTSTPLAVTYTVLLVLAGMLDNVLKPLLLGRGVEAPMPVILLGALGGMVAGGILGMFIGAVFLALGYQIFMGWVASNPAARPPAAL